LQLIINGVDDLQLKSEMTDNINLSNYEFRKFKGRLAQYKVWEDTPDSWEKRWSKRSIHNLLNSYSDGRLDEFGFFEDYLPKHLPVLEAGCGMGQLVMALSARGYHVIGIDYAAETIERIKEAAPQLDVSVGDVYSLEVPVKSLGGYISTGVFEHNPAGPIQGLREVTRVLHPEGVAFIAVPFLNLKRQRVLHDCDVAESEILDNGLCFYQYYFSVEDFENLLQEAGLMVVETYPYALYAGLTRDFAVGRWLNSRRSIFWHLQSWIGKWCRIAPRWIRQRNAHMMMFICKLAD
jgi:SAM-dependent methyltransferase